MKATGIVRKVDEDIKKESAVKEIIEFDEPVEISGDAEFIYIATANPSYYKNLIH